MKYLEATVKQFRYYEMLGTKSIERLSETEIFEHPAKGSNNMAMIVKHMVGNMLSRWTDFLTADGEKTWRNRDEEFADDLESKESVLAEWKKGWQCFYDAVLPLSDDDLNRTVLIRNQQHTIVEAINRQLAHYAYHVGQMVFLAKMKLGDKWESLSIAPGESKKYNEKKFTNKDQSGHFTDEFLDNK